MNWIALCVLYTNIVILQAKHELNIKKLIEIIRRRNALGNSDFIIGAPRYPEHLPEAEAIMPGHTLIRPAMGMLKSAVKFPLRDLGGSVVYGNEDNIGLSYGKNERVLYGSFRKSRNILATLARAIQKSRLNERSLPLVIYAESPAYIKSKKHSPKTVVSHTDEENNAREIIEKLDPERDFFEDNMIDFRRKKSRSKYRKRSNEVSESTGSDSTSGSSEYERNPGNPYTIHKNKYKWNWMWNHFMDGDHMNVNPYAPKFKQEGPSGPDLFFGRKWWYFNQDDYKPMK